MTRRVIYDSTAASPLRVSVAGVDAATAEFNDLIFDGNQSPMRLWGSGFLTIPGITANEFGGGKNLNAMQTAALFPTPAGTAAMFKVMWRNSLDTLNRVYTPTFSPANGQILGGGGGGIASGVFKGVNFAVGAGASPDTPGVANYCNYLVFKNYL